MATSFGLYAITRRSSSIWSRNDLRRMSLLRSYSSAASDANDTLPLAGIRVLDMTRVLAGVSGCIQAFIRMWLTFSIAQPYCTQILGDLGYAQPFHLGEHLAASSNILERC